MPQQPTAEQLARLAALDASDPLARGALQHQLRQTPNHERLHALIRAKLDAATARPAPPARHNPPASPPARTGKERSRDLTPGEAAWIAGLPSEPAEVTSADATTLATIAHEIRGEGDRRLIAAHLDPVRRYHADRTEARDLERRIYTAPRASVPKMEANPAGGQRSHPDWQDWLNVIGEAVQAEHPDCNPAEARGRVGPLVDAAAERIHAAYDPAPDRARLGDLLRSTGARSEVFPAAHTWRGEQ